MEKIIDGNISPVIFVPGILGTKLYDYYPLDTQMLYSAVLDSHTDFDPIMLDEKGLYDKYLDKLIYGNEIISQVYGEIIGELRDCLTLSGSEHVKVYVFPYDWRYSIKSNAKKLGAFVDLIIAKSNAHKTYIDKGGINKVNLIGHSMGGCIIKYYATVLKNENQINKLIMLAAPLRGSLYALKQLIMGESWFFGQLIRKGKRKASRTFPGSYDLLPFDGFSSQRTKIPWSTPAVVDYDNKPVNIFIESKWQPNVIKSIKDEIGNDTLSNNLCNSSSFFEEGEDFTENFRSNVLAIYGTGENTLRHVKVSENFEYEFPDDNDSPKCGDGTVPAVSAYSEGIYQICVTKTDVGDWELDLGKLAGFHASFYCYDKIQDYCISFLRGAVNISVRRSGVENITDFKRFAPADIQNLG
ncbi:MAG: alpha/beta fold hydrolase [Nitrospirae bacterium]|nr:alpha/beta fold hydrolase [Nitrospirota bacterium]